MTRTLLQQALDALHPQANRAFVEATKDALRYALAAPQPEPVPEPFLCIAPACGNDCSDCNKAISAQTMRDYAIAHAAALAAPQPEPWMPIETAPKDGGMFLVWISGVRYGEDENGQQYQQEESQVDFAQWRTFEDGGYVDCFGNPYPYDQWGATHWMPLPAAPGAAPPAAPAPAVPSDDAAEILAGLFNCMPKEALNNDVPDKLAKRIGAFMFAAGYRMVFDRWYLQEPPAAPAVPVSWDRLRTLMDGIPTREEFIGGQRQKYVAKEAVMSWLHEGQLRAEREAAQPAAPAVQVVLRQPNLFASAPAVPDAVLDSLGMHDAAVKLARRMGYTWEGGEWSTAPAVPQEPIYGKYTADDLVRGVLQTAAPAVREPQDERAAFEAWHSEYRGLLPLRRDDSYFDTHARLRWEGWQARAHGIEGGGK